MKYLFGVLASLVFAAPALAESDTDRVFGTFGEPNTGLHSTMSDEEFDELLRENQKKVDAENKEYIDALEKEMEEAAAKAAAESPERKAAKKALLERFQVELNLEILTENAKTYSQDDMMRLINARFRELGHCSAINDAEAQYHAARGNDSSFDQRHAKEFKSHYMIFGIAAAQFIGNPDAVKSSTANFEAGHPKMIATILNWMKDDATVEDNGRYWNLEKHCKAKYEELISLEFKARAKITPQEIDKQIAQAVPAMVEATPRPLSADDQKVRKEAVDILVRQKLVDAYVVTFTQNAESQNSRELDKVLGQDFATINYCRAFRDAQGSDLVKKPSDAAPNSALTDLFSNGIAALALAAEKFYDGEHSEQKIFSISTNAYQHYYPQILEFLRLPALSDKQKGQLETIEQQCTQMQEKLLASTNQARSSITETDIAQKMEIIKKPSWE